MNAQDEQDALLRKREEQEKSDLEMRTIMAEREMAVLTGEESASDKALRETPLSDYVHSGPDAWGRERPVPAEDPVASMSMDEYQEHRKELERGQGFGHISGGRFPERFSGVAADETEEGS